MKSTIAALFLAARTAAASAQYGTRNLHMRSLVLGVPLAALALLASVANAPAAAPTKFQSHCQTYNSVCQRCAGVGATVSKSSCLATCRTRLAQCQKTGCYYFNVPGPRCASNTTGSN